MQRAFSIVEMSIIIVIVGFLVAGLTQVSRVITQMRLNSARAQSISSGVLAIDDLALWLDATAEKAIVTSVGSTNPDDGDKIATWRDSNKQISNKNDATQATDAARPTYATNSLNNLPAVKFTSASSNFLLINNAFTKSFSLFVVVRTTVVGNVGLGSGGIPIIWADAQTNSYDGVPLSVTGGIANTFNGSPDSSLTHPNTINDDKAHIIFVSRNIETGVRYVVPDATALSSDAGGAAGVVLNDNVGALIGANTINNTYFDGYIGEIISFNRALPDDERKIVEKYLSKKWGVKLFFN